MCHLYSTYNAAVFEKLLYTTDFSAREEHKMPFELRTRPETCSYIRKTDRDLIQLKVKQNEKFFISGYFSSHYIAPSTPRRDEQRHYYYRNSTPRSATL